MRKIIQIAITGDRLFALCNDGSIWERNIGLPLDSPAAEWTPVPRIPNTAVEPSLEG